MRAKRYVFVLLLWLSPPACALASAEMPTEKDSFDDEMFNKLSEEEKNLLLEYREKYDALKDFYSNATMRAALSQFDFSANTTEKGKPPTPGEVEPGLQRAFELDFRSNSKHERGEFLRIDERCIFAWSETPKPINPNENRFISEKIGIVNPIGGYVRLLEKKDKDAAAYTLVNEQKVNDYLYPVRYKYNCSAFAPHGTFLENWIFNRRGVPIGNQYTIDYVRPIEENGNNIVVLQSTVRVSNGETMVRTIKFFRDRSWALKDMVDEGNNRYRKALCTYKGDKDGIPLLATARNEFKISKDSKSKALSREEFDVFSITPGPVGITEFDADRFVTKK